MRGLDDLEHIMSSLKIVSFATKDSIKTNFHNYFFKNVD
mgnify:CR=1 FL=1